MCPGTDLSGLLAILGSAGEVAEDVGTVASVAGAAEGADAAFGAGGGGDTTAGLDPTAAIADTPGGLAQTQDLTGGIGQTSSTLSPAAQEAPLDGITVNAPNLSAGAGGGGSALGNLAGGAGMAAGLPQIASSIGGGPATPQGGGGGPPSDIQPDIGDQPLLASNNPGQFLAATGSDSPSALSPDVMQSLGIDPSSLGDTSGAFDPSSVSNPDSLSFDNGPSFMDKIEKYLSSPKNDASLGLLGISGANALSKPKLPGADQTAANAAGAGVKQAESVIQSGGTASPEWGTQKASIDATIDNQIKQQTESMMQAAAANGEGNQNSGIVQQQIAQMTQQANLQRQQLYAQAQQQNVNNAVQELTGSDQVLTSIGNTELQQSEEARALAGQTGELALLLQSGTKFPITSNSSTGP
jgi:hypothetical protein